MRWSAFLALSCAAATVLLSFATAGPARARQADPRLELVRLRVRDGVGWHANAEFRLDWDGVLGRPAPHVLAVDYLVRDAAGDVVVPTVRIESAGASVLEHVEVPPLAGKYTAEVWVEGDTTVGPPSSAQLWFDPTRPSPSRPLVPPGWIRAGVPIAIGLEHPAAPWPVSGLLGYAIAVEGGEGAMPCAGPDVCTFEETDLRDGADADSIAIGPLPEGTSIVRAVAVSGSGMRSEQVRSAELHADGGGPTVAFAGVPAGWSNRPARVTARATDMLSGMAPSDSSGALTAISVDGELASFALGGEAIAIVHGAGVHVLTASARDAVGNPSEAAAGASVRIDETPPRLAFAPVEDPAEPERIEALLADSLSGIDLARGSIAVRPEGSRATFAPLPTVHAGGRMITVWDSDSFPPGSYEFEAIGYDAAGNRTLADRRAGGAPMVLPAPLKTSTAIVSGFGGRRALVQSCSRTSGSVRCQRRMVNSYSRRPRLWTVGYGQGIAIGGRLDGPTGSPLGGQEVSILETFDAGASEGQRTSYATTALDGTFLAVLPPGPSRHIRVEFRGTPLMSRARSRWLRLAVRTPVRLSVSAPTATIGGAAVVFSGSVGPDGAAIPEAGLPVALQFRIGEGAWSEFRSVQTDAHGRFRYPYAFVDGDSRGVRFQFHAIVPTLPGWPYARGISPVVHVVGR